MGIIIQADRKEGKSDRTKGRCKKMKMTLVILCIVHFIAVDFNE
jgi:hypothetical protein